MPVDTENREYRSMSAVMEPAAEAGEGSFLVRGYATTWDDPYLLYESGGRQVWEQVARGAVDAESDTSDVIFQYDHSGPVMARISNATLSVVADDPHGLLVEADLGKSPAARGLWEEIKNGLVTRMSWAFKVDRSSVDRDRPDGSVLRTIEHVSKVFDVSAVSIPANDATEISARRALGGGTGERRRESPQRRREMAACAARLRLAGR